VQEQSLAQIPKLFAVMFAALLLLAPCLQILRDYCERILAQLNTFGLS
jgi:flagellar biosynthesis protein FliQ